MATKLDGPLKKNLPSWKNNMGLVEILVSKYDKKGEFKKKNSF